MKLKEAAVGSPDGWRLHTHEAHLNYMESSGFEVESQYDMTAAVLASIRSGFYNSLAVLAKLKTSETQDRAESVGHYWKQIETWGAVYALFESGKLKAAAIVARKRR
ncbi:MAG TPA: hypothetical protein VHI52_08100 [Verrucomicrobiae bacterium]|nr:hypothetical protein [Verrucomicrobiae bacterium]